MAAVSGAALNHRCLIDAPVELSRLRSAVRPSPAMKRSSVRCSSANAGGAAVEMDSSEVMKFRMSDFVVSDHVSLGLQGRSDELIFEGTVCDANSSLYNSRVVLRQLTSRQAKRRGRRALEVLKKLGQRRLMYHSYAMQVHGYVSLPDMDGAPFTLVHGYHGSYSLRHWLQLSDWLPTLEATLALDEESVRRVGDNTIGGPAVTRQLRLTRILMRDLLIAVNYLHSHGLAHTELRLENIHISPVDKHIKVGILGNAADFDHGIANDSKSEGSSQRRKLMIAFDMRCVGFIMAKLILKELMDASTFRKVKTFLTKDNNDPSCLREFLLPILGRHAPSGNAGLQMLDRNWGAGWNLLALLLATKPSERISCLDALRHPFLCGPKWRVQPSMAIIRWGLGSSTVRMAEDYIYVQHQRRRIAYSIELMELLNPNPRLKSWFHLLPGRWRMLYSTGRHIGLTFRQPNSRVLICDAYLTFKKSANSYRRTLSLSSEISFKVMSKDQWPHDKSGTPGNLKVISTVKIAPGRRLYLEVEGTKEFSEKSAVQNLASKKLIGNIKELPLSLPAMKIWADDIDVSLSFESSLDVDVAKNVLQEVRTQIPFEMFDVSRIVCGTYVDSRMLVLRGVDGSALLLTRSCL